MKLRKNNKGSVQDLPLIMVYIFVFAVVIILGVFMLNKFNEKVQELDSFTPAAKTVVSDTTSSYETTQNGMFLFFAITLGIVAIILAALVRIHPIFIILFILVLIIIVFVCGAFSEAYQKMSATDALSGSAAEVPIVVTIMNNLPLIILVIGSIMCIVMYRNWSMLQ